MLVRCLCIHVKMADCPIQLPNDSFKDLFSQAEAFDFIRDVLEVDINNTMNCNGADKLQLLNDAIRGFYYQEPFNNLELMGSPRDKLKRPSAKQIKHSMLKRRGGLCYVMNTFFSTLMNAVGFTSYTGLGYVRKPPQNHVVCYFNNVKDVQDMYLVDVGVGMPTYEAIDLNFTKESQIYTQSFQSYKYERNGSDRLSRIVTRGAGPDWPSRSDGSTKMCEVGTARKSLREIQLRADIIYGNPMMSPFLDRINIVKFADSGTIALCNYSLLVENQDGEMDKAKIEVDQLSETIMEILPRYDYNIVEAAVKNFRQLSQH